MKKGGGLERWYIIILHLKYSIKTFEILNQERVLNKGATLEARFIQKSRPILTIIRWGMEWFGDWAFHLLEFVGGGIDLTIGVDCHTWQKK